MIIIDLEKSNKRHKALQSLSHDHLLSLMLCWKISTGLSREIETERIKSYAYWFFQNHLRQHFEVEEKYIFSILSYENELIKKAVIEHNRLIQLFESEDNVKSNLSLIEIELKEHIRFEERTLFNAIQNASTTKVFKMIEMLQDENTFCVNWEDTFWKTNHTIPNN